MSEYRQYFWILVIREIPVAKLLVVEDHFRVNRDPKILVITLLVESASRADAVLDPANQIKPAEAI